MEIIFYWQIHIFFADKLKDWDVNGNKWTYETIMEKLLLMIFSSSTEDWLWFFKLKLYSGVYHLGKRLENVI